MWVEFTNLSISHVVILWKSSQSVSAVDDCLASLLWLLPHSLLPPASTSADGVEFSFPFAVVDWSRKPPILFCQSGVGLSQTEFPPAYLFLLLLGEEHDDEFPELPPPRAFLGACAVTTFLEAPLLSACVLTIFTLLLSTFHAYSLLMFNFNLPFWNHLAKWTETW